MTSRRTRGGPYNDHGKQRGEEKEEEDDKDTIAIALRLIYHFAVLYSPL